MPGTSVNHTIQSILTSGPVEYLSPGAEELRGHAEKRIAINSQRLIRHNDMARCTCRSVVALLYIYERTKTPELKQVNTTSLAAPALVHLWQLGGTNLPHKQKTEALCPVLTALR